MKNLSALILFVALPCLLFSQVNLSNGLTAYYPFTGNAQDASGSGNNGTVFGPTLTADRFGQPNSAYFFDGINDYISILSNQNLQIPYPYTISYWCKIHDYNHNPVFTNNYAANNYYGVQINMLTGYAGIGYGDSGPTGPTNRRSFTSTTTQTALFQWYHVVGIVWGPTNMALYLNGKRECGLYSGSGGAQAYNGLPGAIGRTGTAQGDEYFFGAIDDIRFYNRALNEDEIAALQDLTPGATNQDTTLCQGQSVILDGGDATTYAWSPAAGLSCTNCQNPVASPTTTTQYQVITNGQTACPDTLSILVTVQACNPCDTANINALFGYSTNGNTVNLLDISTGGTTSYWTFGDGNTALWPSGTDFPHTYAQPGTYTICLINQLTVGGSVCADTLCQAVVINSPCSATNVNALFGYLTTGLSVDFTDFSTGGSTSVWNFGDNTTVQNPTGTAVTHVYSQSGTYTVCLINQIAVAGGVLCSDTICETLTVSAPCDSVQIGADFTWTVSGYQVQFTDLSTGPNLNSVLWDFGDGSSVSTAPGATPTHTYTVPGSFQVCVNVYRNLTDKVVCGDTICKTVDIWRTGIEDEMAANFSLYSAEGNIYLRQESGEWMPLEVSVWAMNAAQVSPEQEVLTLPARVSATRLAAGLYAVRITNAKGVIMKKIWIP